MPTDRARPTTPDTRRPGPTGHGWPPFGNAALLAAYERGVAAGREQAAADPFVEELAAAVGKWHESMVGLMDDTSPEEDALHDAYEAAVVGRIRSAIRAAYAAEIAEGTNHA